MIRGFHEFPIFLRIRLITMGQFNGIALDNPERPAIAWEEVLGSYLRSLGGVS